VICYRKGKCSAPRAGDEENSTGWRAGNARLRSTEVEGLVPPEKKRRLRHSRTQERERLVEGLGRKGGEEIIGHP